MLTGRLRQRADCFVLRGWTYPYHPLADGPSLGRLDPDSDEVQLWKMHSGREVEVRPGDVQDIAKQVMGLDLPGRRQRAQEAPPPKPEASPPSLAASVSVSPPIDFTDLMKGAGAPDEFDIPRSGEPKGPVVPEEIAALLEPGEELTPERVRFMAAALNDEKVRLRDRRLLGKAGADELRREGDVDALLGLFARLGEV